MKFKDIIKNKWGWTFFLVVVFLIIIFPLITNDMDCNFRMKGYPQICSETGEIKLIEPQYVQITPECCPKYLQPINDMGVFMHDGLSNLLLNKGIIPRNCEEFLCTGVLFASLFSTIIWLVIAFPLGLLFQWLWRKIRK